MSKRLWQIVVAAAVVLVLGVLAGLYVSGRLPGRQPVVTPPVQPVPGRTTTRQPRPRPAGLSLRGQVEAAQTREVTSPRDGRVVALGCSERQPVAQGQLLMQVDVPALRQQLADAKKRLAHLQALAEKADDPELRDRLNAAEARAREAVARQQRMQAELNEFESQHPEVAAVLNTYQAAEAEAASADMAYRNAQHALAEAQKQVAATGKRAAQYDQVMSRYQAAYARQRAAQNSLEQARGARWRLQSDVVKLNVLRQRVASGKNLIPQAQAALEKLRRRPEVAMIARGKQQVEEAAAQVSRLEAEVAKLALTAPASGLLREIRARPGQQVRAGQCLAVISESGGARLVFQASLRDGQRLAVGMKATVSLPDGSTFVGTLSQLAPEKTLVRVYVVPLKHRELPPPGTPLTVKL